MSELDKLGVFLGVAAAAGVGLQLWRLWNDTEDEDEEGDTWGS